jgi:hypothetical protein
MIVRFERTRSKRHVFLEKNMGILQDAQDAFEYVCAKCRRRFRAACRAVTAVGLGGAVWIGGVAICPSCEKHDDKPEQHSIERPIQDPNTVVTSGTTMSTTVPKATVVSGEGPPPFGGAVIMSRPAGITSAATPVPRMIVVSGQVYPPFGGTVISSGPGGSNQTWSW